nr:dipeptide ABC transporter permease DppC [Yersinia frederiksenii]
MSQLTESTVKNAPKPMTPLQEFWHYFKRNKGAVIGLFYIILMLLIAAGATWLARTARQSNFATHY